MCTAHATKQNTQSLMEAGLTDLEDYRSGEFWSSESPNY